MSSLYTIKIVNLMIRSVPLVSRATSLERVNEKAHKGYLFNISFQGQTET